MLSRVILVSACLVSVTQGLFWGDSPEWDGLKVTFSLNPLSGKPSSVPRTTSKAEDEGWTKLNDCDVGRSFRGARYVKDGDYAVILLFDVNGYIAGIQTGVPNTDATYPPEKQRGRIFQDDGEGHFILTAYFTDPATICTEGRTQEQYEKEGTGSVLYIQNGTNPETDLVRIPNKQEEVAQQSGKWSEGKCFLWMGKHYWHALTEDMSCDDFQPVFLLYHKGKLNAFGWALGMGLDSPRFEHPTYKVTSKFMNPVPTCLKNYDKLSTLHIYMTDSPRLALCLPSWAYFWE